MVWCHEVLFEVLLCQWSASGLLGMRCCADMVLWWLAVVWCGTGVVLSLGGCDGGQVEVRRFWRCDGVVAMGWRWSVAGVVVVMVCWWRWW